MPSPFPGMNPYLEQDAVWHAFHQHQCAHCLEYLVPQVRPKYVAKLEAPVYALLPVTVDIERESLIEIRDRQSLELITVIELLSPANKKPGSDREQYLAKRRQYFANGVNLVEIDLLRGYERLPLEKLPESDYYALVSRTEERPRVGVWPLRLRDRLPIIPVPLRRPDPDATLDLQHILNRVYDAAGYADYIYDGTPQPSLHPDDAAWALQFLPAK